MKHNTFYKNTLWQYGLQILKYLFPLLLIPYLTRILGTEGYAVYAYVLSFMGVVKPSPISALHSLVPRR